MTIIIPNAQFCVLRVRLFIPSTLKKINTQQSRPIVDQNIVTKSLFEMGILGPLKSLDNPEHDLVKKSRFFLFV